MVVIRYFICFANIVVIFLKLKGLFDVMLYTLSNKMMYSRRQIKVPIYRPYNGTGNTVPFPFRSRLISVRLVFLSVFKPFPFCSKGSSSVLVNDPDGENKRAWSLLAQEVIIRCNVLYTFCNKIMYVQLFSKYIHALLKL